MKRIISLIIVVLTIFSIVSCDEKKVYEEEAKNFSKDGMTITLTEAFKETTQKGYTAMYDSNEADVFILKENFDSFDSKDMSLDKYAGFVREANKSKSPTEISNENGFLSMEYLFEDEENNKIYKYLTAMLEGPDAYWFVQFTCEESVYEEYRPYFVKWVKTVTFAPKS